MSLIAATSTKASLTVRCRLDKHPYPGDAKVTAAQMATIQLTPQPFYGDWNYTIHPAEKRE